MYEDLPLQMTFPGLRPHSGLTVGRPQWSTGVCLLSGGRGAFSGQKGLSTARFPPKASQLPGLLVVSRNSVEGRDSGGRLT